MKSISLYVDKDTYLTRMHPFTKLCYILTAVAASLITGKLWAFAIFIGISLVMLISGKIMKKVFPLIAFSFTILITIFLIHGLFNHENANLMFQLGPLKFYREGMMYALRISCNVLNMLLAFAVFVLTTKPAELVEDLEQAGFSPKIGYVISSVFQILPKPQYIEELRGKRNFRYGFTVYCQSVVWGNAGFRPYLERFAPGRDAGKRSLSDDYG